MLLEVENLHVHYGRLAALRGISLAVAEGEIACIVGPNGAGKSTTLLAISSILAPSQGTITFDGASIGGTPAENVAALGISQVPEGRHIFTSLSVDENLQVGAATRKDKAGIRADYYRVLELFPILGERRRQSAGKLSGGEQQMLAIGRALMSNPRFLTIDEPSLGLAPKIVDQVYEVLIDLRNSRGLTLLLVEQSSERALNVADRLYVLRNGEIQLEGKTADLQDGKAVHEAYFGFTHEHDEDEVEF
jgi:branched-chain amino acid transport system ATP-binding protein